MTYQFAYGDIARALTFALSEDPFYITVGNAVSDDPEEAREGMFRYMDYSMREAEKYGKLFLPEESFGASIWTRPVDDDVAKRISAEKKSFLKEYLGEGSLRKYVEITDFMSEACDGVVSDDCWYLSILGVAPELQGQGRGEGLVRPILDRTDELGVATYLETFTSRNKSFYNRLGYKDAASFMEPGTGSEYWIMVREPSRTGAR